MDSLVCYLSSKLLTTASIWSRFMHVSHRLTPLGTLTLYCNFFRALMSLTPVYQWQRSLSFFPGSLVTIFFFELCHYPAISIYGMVCMVKRWPRNFCYFFLVWLVQKKLLLGVDEKSKSIMFGELFPRDFFYRWSLTKTTNKLSQLTVAKCGKLLKR